jgi:hypothetical protein
MVQFMRRSLLFQLLSIYLLFVVIVLLRRRRASSIPSMMLATTLIKSPGLIQWGRFKFPGHRVRSG